MSCTLPQPLAVSNRVHLWAVPFADFSDGEGIRNMPLPAPLTPFSSCFSPWVLRQASAPTRTPGGSGLPQSRRLPPLATPEG